MHIPRREKEKPTFGFFPLSFFTGLSIESDTSKSWSSDNCDLPVVYPMIAKCDEEVRNRLSSGLPNNYSRLSQALGTVAGVHYSFTSEKLNYIEQMQVNVYC